MTLDSNGTLYGTTSGTGIGKTCYEQNACGTVFKYDLNAKVLTTLHAFSFSDGEYPLRAPLVFGKAGKLFGVTAYGGDDEPEKYPNGLGGVFRIDPVSGAFDMLIRFSTLTAPFGIAPDADKNLYVTAGAGGVNGTGEIIKMVPGVGAPYTISTLYSFDPGNENMSGESPEASLTFDSTKKVFYGTAFEGGVDGYGTMFQIDPESGAFTLLHSFTGGTDGKYLDDGILIDLGELYGATRGFRATKLPQQCVGAGCGTLFKLPRF